jgi:hypothetical protein
MVSCSTDEAGQILTVSYGQHVSPKEVEECLKTIEEQMKHLKPGFVMLSDLTAMESMDEACATPLGAIMELCSSRGMTATVRIIPDPSKDIGFNLISLFHFQNPVRTYTHPNLAEAMKCLVAEFPATTTAP